MVQSPTPLNTLVQLRTHLAEQFELTELYNLCADMGWNYQDLAHTTRGELALAMVDRADRRGYVAELTRLAYLRKYAPPPRPAPDELPAPGQLLPGSRMLFGRNQEFTGRQAALTQLWQSFTARPASGNASAAMLITQAIQGMGGVGKSQLAGEFAYRYGRFTRGVHWINAAQPDLNGLGHSEAQSDKESLLRGEAGAVSIPRDSICRWRCIWRRAIWRGTLA
jgi:hypothetical protein